METAVPLDRSDPGIVATSGAVHVWYCLTAQLSARAEAQARELLSPGELQRCDRFRFAHDRRDYAAAHALLRSALTAHEGAPPSSWVFEAHAGGKPFLAAGQSPVEFNLAHTTGLVACAVTKAGRVGVDAESYVRAVNASELAERFSAQEIAGLRGLAGREHHRRFIELWTLKEAYVKAIGLGLEHPLSGFSFDLDGASRVRFHPPSGTSEADWQFRLFAPSDEHRLAVAVQQQQSIQFHVREWQFR
jgi:4'-phosphopantetheinyl transferase